MEFEHISVLPQEVIAGLNIKPDGIYVDCTLGGAGHASRIAEKLNDNGHLIGIDQDDDAIAAATSRLKPYKCKIDIVHSNFKNLEQVLKDLQIEFVDGFLFDLGVSSYQLDEAERGFSYMHDAPLDMRMDKTKEFSAYNVVNEEMHMQIREMAELVARDIANGEIKVRYEIPENSLVFGYAPKVKMHMSGKKLMNLGWRPHVGMKEAYLKMIHDMEQGN